MAKRTIKQPTGSQIQYKGLMQATVLLDIEVSQWVTAGEIREALMTILRGSEAAECYPVKLVEANQVVDMRNA